jgi:hypothetical protein
MPGIDPWVTYLDPSDHAVTPLLSVQVPERSGAQHPARKATTQLPNIGLVGSEQAPASAPPAPDDVVAVLLPVAAWVLVVPPPVLPWLLEAPAPPAPGVVSPFPDEEEQAAPATRAAAIA